MNKLISTLTLIVFSICAKAQTEKGTVYVGGNAAFSRSTSSQNTSSYANSQVYVSPTVGVFVAKNFSIGLTPQYSYSETSYSSLHYNGAGYSTSVSKDETNLLGGGIDLRYYIAIVPKLYFFPQLSTSYRVSVGKADVDTKVINANLSPNITFFATQKLALNFSYGALYYTHQTDKSPIMASKNESFGLSINQGTALGINFYFN
jgi:hypothetical protein